MEAIQKNWILLLVALVSMGCEAWEQREPSTMATAEFRLHGKANGGIFVLGCLPCGMPKLAYLKTQAGQDSVQILESTGRFLLRSLNTPVLEFTDDRLIVAYREDIFVCGTETGLGIPSAIRHLTVNYEPSDDTASLVWKAPCGEPFDWIQVSYNNYPAELIIAHPSTPGGERFLVEHVKQCVQKVFRRETEVPDLTFALTAQRHGTPSPAAVIRMVGLRMEERGNLPFYCGLAPNWARWQIDGNSEIQLGEGRHLLEGGESRNTVLWTPSDIQAAGLDFARERYSSGSKRGPCFQVLCCMMGRHGTGGVFRRFLGLKSGHIYRVGMSVNTLDSHLGSGNWRFSIHGCLDSPSGNELTAQQMAGGQALPDGRIGRDAGLLAAFGPGERITDGNWVELCTGQDVESNTIGDFAISEGVSSITVWLRLQVEDSQDLQETVEVGAGWIWLEDVTNVVRQ